MKFWLGKWEINFVLFYSFSSRDRWEFLEIECRQTILQGLLQILMWCDKCNSGSYVWNTTEEHVQGWFLIPGGARVWGQGILEKRGYGSYIWKHSRSSPGWVEVRALQACGREEGFFLEEPIVWCDVMISPFLKGDLWQCREIGWETREGV